MENTTLQTERPAQVAAAHIYPSESALLSLRQGVDLDSSSGHNVDLSGGNIQDSIFRHEVDEDEDEDDVTLFKEQTGNIPHLSQADEMEEVREMLTDEEIEYIRNIPFEEDQCFESGERESESERKEEYWEVPGCKNLRDVIMKVKELWDMEFNREFEELNMV
jgi:hypothetical protein